MAGKARGRSDKRHKRTLSASLPGSATFFEHLAVLNIYLDESGDLGWKFDRPYRRGGSSRFLTIAYIICPPHKKDVLKRIVKKAYKKYHADPQKEFKGSMLSNVQKEWIANMIANFLIANPDVSIGAITVKKQNVQLHIREDSNKLYNYMLKLAFLDEIKGVS